MKKNFSINEQRYLRAFSEGTTFYYKNNKYRVLEAGKPTTNRGEPKTDLYILAKNSFNEVCEFKISFKQVNADFLENKISAARAREIFGENWKEIIIDSLYSLEDSFLERPLIYKKRFARTEEGSITLGWKYEFINKPGGYLSGKLNINSRNAEDIYTGVYLGENLSREKRDAYVNGRIIQNSGVANFMLTELDTKYLDSQRIIDKIVPLSEYVQEHPDIYFACKALNYRTYRKKYDGNRPLAVFIEWFINEDGKLDSIIDFDNPLIYGGNAACEYLSQALQQLGVRDTRDLHVDNVANPLFIYD